MRSITVTAVIIAIAAVNQAKASLINGGFENGFTGFATIGDTSIVTSTFGSGPTQGTFEALLTTISPYQVPPGNAADVSILEPFLGLSPGQLSTLTTDPFGVTDGSAITQTFTASKGSVLKFDYNFLTNELLQLPPFNDLAFVEIGSTLIKLTDVSTATLVASNTVFANETGFQTYSYTIPATGTYTFGIGVAGVEDVFGQSAILVDNITLTSGVPEPTSMIPLGIGMATLAGYSVYRGRRSP